MRLIAPPSMRVRPALLAIGAIVVTVLGGCSSLISFEPAATAAPCAMAFKAARCEVIRVAMARELGVEVEAVVSMEVLPDPTPERAPDGGIILRTTSGGRSPDIAVVLADGSRHRVTLHCGGISGGFVPACMDQPTLRVESVVLGGYRDVPCTGETAETCATPQPPISAAAQPIEVEALDIPIDQVGLVEIPVGGGSVPNGILTEASFVLADAWPEGLVILDGGVRLEVRSLEPDGRPFDNYYQHGWREGVERVEAVLVVQVDHVEPGALLRIRDLVVR